MALSRDIIHTLGLIAAVALPFWNIPLIIRIRRRKSSRDISLAWAVGVLSCVWLMLPAALISSDAVFKLFSILNTALFTTVVLEIIRYRQR